jgi:hypothetical protein
MSRFALYAKLAILALLLTISFHLTYYPPPSIPNLSTLRAEYQYADNYYTDTLLTKTPAELGKHQDSKDRLKESGAAENQSSEHSNTQEGFADQTEQYKDEFDNVPIETPQERHCFHSGIHSQTPIPNVLNFIWLNNTELSFLGYLAIRAALVSLKPDRLNLHYTDLNLDNQWLRKVSSDITLIPHDLQKEYPKQVKEKWHLAHVSDVMRLDILQREGGIYFDTDIIALQPFENLLHSPKDLVLGHESRDRGGLCNGIILARPGATFMDRWMASYSSFELGEWNTHSVVLPKQWSLEFPEEVCTLSPATFFWPSWGDGVPYMHEVLDDTQALEFENKLAKHNGSMYPHQLAYHAWHQVAPQLDKLTPDIIMSQNTRFNMLVRRFIE